MNRHYRRYIVASFLIFAIAISACRDESPRTTASEVTTAATDTTFFQELSWSPDGSRLLLSRIDIHDNYRTSIAVVNADGSGYRQLTAGPADMWTSWSRDGLRFAFASENDGNRDIFVMPIDDGDASRMTSDPGEDTHPHWSKDGTAIAFISDRTGKSQIYSMRADGSGVTQLTSSADDKWNPRWSPDGKKIVYYGSSGEGADSVYVISASGQDRYAIGPGVWPSWSADGSHILFVDGRDVFEMAVNGTNRELVLEDAVIARWSPDGSKIGFVRVTWRAPAGWPAMAHVFEAAPDGSHVRQLTR